jgi:hypothetical protein
MSVSGSCIQAACVGMKAGSHLIKPSRSLHIQKMPQKAMHMAAKIVQSKSKSVSASLSARRWLTVVGGCLGCLDDARCAFDTLKHKLQPGSVVPRGANCHMVRPDACNVIVMGQRRAVQDQHAGPGVRSLNNV